MKREVEDRDVERVIPNIYHIRELGRQGCLTEGSQHYKTVGVEPIEYAIANGRIENFAVVNVHKYIERFTVTRNLDDLKKVVDYAHILCGIEIDKREWEDKTYDSNTKR